MGLARAQRAQRGRSSEGARRQVSARAYKGQEEAQPPGRRSKCINKKLESHNNSKGETVDVT